ncbi:MAG: hypothetical protein HYT43_02075 [Candidatus Taylorbacteria bacterium]|nr:hypothetical protein [Candidatus Taylorbacteria bacterium]
MPDLDKRLANETPDYGKNIQKATKKLWPLFAALTLIIFFRGCYMAEEKKSVRAAAELGDRPVDPDPLKYKFRARFIHVADTDCPNMDNEALFYWAEVKEYSDIRMSVVVYAGKWERRFPLAYFCLNRAENPKSGKYHFQGEWAEADNSNSGTWYLEKINFPGAPPSFVGWQKDKRGKLDSFSLYPVARKTERDKESST